MIKTRDEAITLLTRYVRNERMLNHCYASEAVMKALARRLRADEHAWGMAGLLHDLDVEVTGGDLSVHGLESEKILGEEGFDPEIIDCIKRHNEAAHSLKRESVFHHALAAGETVTGLITATALVYPDKKIAGVKPKSVVKRMKERAFAASVNRDVILECETIGIPLEEFVILSLDAMKEISGDIGL